MQYIMCEDDIKVMGPVFQDVKYFNGELFEIFVVATPVFFLRLQDTLIF